MKKSFRIKIRVFLIISLLIILFPTYINSMQKKEELPLEIIIGGELLQVNINTKKIMYYKQESNKGELTNYDLIYKINDKNIKTRDDIFKFVLNNTNNNVKILVFRNGEKKTIYVNKSELKPSYFNEYVPFSATLTYINPNNGEFGAVAHNIKIENLDNILSKKGNIHLCNSLEIKKSNEHEVGTIHGEIESNELGTINKINNFGAKGYLNLNNLKEKQIYKVGRTSEVRLGLASLVINNSSEESKKFYDIEITKINKQEKPSTQGFEFEVTDKEFLNEYGGILQGMSGSPIIQNGKIIGALSHVISNNTKMGIGLYIEWMMEK